MPVAHILLALLVTLIWGLNFVVIKVGLGDFPPLLFCALRFALAALPLLVLRGPMPAPFGRILLIGVLLGWSSSACCSSAWPRACRPGCRRWCCRARYSSPSSSPPCGWASGRRRAGCSASCWRRRGWS